MACLSTKGNRKQYLLFNLGFPVTFNRFCHVVQVLSVWPRALEFRFLWLSFAAAAARHRTSEWYVAHSQAQRYVAHSQAQRYVAHSQAQRYVAHSQAQRYVAHSQAQWYVAHSQAQFGKYATLRAKDHLRVSLRGQHLPNPPPPPPPPITLPWQKNFFCYVFSIPYMNSNKVSLYKTNINQSLLHVWSLLCVSINVLFIFTKYLKNFLQTTMGDFLSFI